MADANLDIKVNVEGKKASADLDKLAKQAQEAARQQAQAALRLAKIEADSAAKANRAIEAKARAAERAAAAAERASQRESRAAQRAAQVAAREADNVARAMERQRQAAERTAARSPAGRSAAAFEAQGQRVAQASFGLNTGAAASASSRTGIGPALNAQAQAATRAFNGAAAAGQRADSVLVRFIQRLRELATATRKAGDEADKADKKTRGFTTGLRGLIAQLAGIGVAVQQFRALVGAAVTADRIMAGLKFSTGSSQAAGEELAFVTEQANRLGLPLKEAAEGYTRLSAAARAAGLSQEDVRQIFLGVAEYGTVVGGLTKEQAQGTLEALQQMASKGKVSSEELRQQLGDRLPGAMALASKAVGMTVDEFQKKLDNGQIKSAEFLKLFAQGLRDAAAKDLPEASRALQAELNRMETAVFSFRSNLAKGGFGEAVKGVVRSITEALNDPAAQRAGESIGAGLGQALTFVVNTSKSLLTGIDEFAFKLGNAFAKASMGIMTEAKIARQQLRGLFASDEVQADVKQQVASLKAQQKAFNDAIAAREAQRRAQKKFEEYQNSPEVANAGQYDEPRFRNAGRYKGQSKDELDKARQNLVIPGASDIEKSAKSLAARLATARAKIAEAIADAEKATATNGLAEQEAALELSYQRRLRTEQQYIREKADLQAAALARELAIQQGLFQTRAAQLNDPALDEAKRADISADLVGIAAEIETLTSKQRQAVLETTKALEASTEAAAEFKRQLQVEIESDDGVSLVDQLKALDAEYAALRAKYADDEVVLALLGVKQKRDTFKLQSAATQKSIGGIDSSLQLREGQLQQDYNEGLLTTLGLQRQLAAARAASAAQLEAEVEKFQRAFDESGKSDPAIFATIEQLKLRIRELRFDAEAFGVQLSRSVGNAFENNIKSARSFKAFFLGVIEDVLTAIRDRLAKQAGESIANSLQGLFKGQAGTGGGGTGGFLSSLASFFTGYADGGLAGTGGARTGGITAPGPKYQIAGFAHAGEYWINQVSTSKLLRKYGRGLLDYINRFGELPRRGYAAGGLAGTTPGSLSVGTGSLLGQAGSTTNINAALYLNPEHAAEAMLSTRTGETRIVEIMLKHRGKL